MCCQQQAAAMNKQHRSRLPAKSGVLPVQPYEHRT
jgi:hypothetical protein